ncbi:MAG: nucleotide pyrophosphohydrolase [Patescibacteria group bacterium]|nr:MAG: nucleotide pyrophosphohydrolase [Patescibacteria group bacterium]
MAFKDAQKQVDDWVDQHKMGYWKPHEILARLTEEVGELAREINHIFGPKKKKAVEGPKKMVDELADVSFTIICLANSQGIDLEEAFKNTMEKCYGRDKNRFEKKN